MTSQFFYLNYREDLPSIIELSYLDNQLIMTCSFDTTCSYIANGYRPSLDYENRCKFIFNQAYLDSELHAPYVFNKLEYTDHLILKINDVSIDIIEDEIKVIQIDM